LKEYILNDVSYKAEELVAFAKSQLGKVSAWEQSHYEVILDFLSDEDYIETPTSGSTGEPKVIRLSKAHLESSAKLTATYFKIRTGSRVLQCLPSKFIAGKMMIIRSLVCGWNLRWVEPSSNPLKDIDEQFDFAAFTPMQASAILNENPEKFKAIKTIIIGGGSASKDLEDKLTTCTNSVYLTYGMTETITHVAERRLTGKNPPNFFQALPGVRFSLDERECLIIEAVHLDNARFETNDVVMLTSPMTFRYLGRIDNVINSGGIKIFPEKIERKIGHLLTRNFFITKDVDSVLGEKMVMYIEGEHYSESELLQLSSAMKMFLHTYEVPKEFRFVKEFEYTETNKVKRKLY
jgi:O-succinylbenzoic acid--CoA ligase